MIDNKFNLFYDFYARSVDDVSGEKVVIFLNPESEKYIEHDYDWFLMVALEKANKVDDYEERKLLTGDLLKSYQKAIYDGYTHKLDPNLRKKNARPKNRNTIKGIQDYIELIKRREDMRICIQESKDGCNGLKKGKPYSEVILCLGNKESVYKINTNIEL